MSKPRRDERRSAREVKRYDSIQRIVEDRDIPLISRVCASELISCVDENGNLRLENKTDVGSGDSWA